MAVVSKMARSKGRVAVGGAVAAAALLAAPSFLAPGQDVPRQMQLQTHQVSTASAGDQARNLNMAAAGASAMGMGAVAALGPRRTAKRGPAKR